MSEQQTNEPFFVRFLESQEVLAVSTDVKAGPRHHTMKWPSDDDEGGEPI